MLSFSPTYISKRSVVRYISGNEGDSIHHMLMFNYLIKKGKGEFYSELSEMQIVILHLQH